MLLTIVVLSPLLAAPLATAAVRTGLASLVCLWPAALFAALATLLPEIMAGQERLERIAWIGSLGIDLAFRADGLSLLFALLITGIGAFIFLYASRYLAGDRDQPKFFSFLTLFTGAMLGAVLADDLITMLVFWELTSFASFLLIGYRPEAQASRRSAQQGFLVTVGGGLAMLAGVLLLGEAAGTYRIGAILAQGPALAALPQAPIVIVLIAAGAFAKSAQAPLHVWLANAMVAPTPVSAFLHSATMVKLGVYLLARLNPVYGEHALWTPLLMSAGLATMLTGTLLALRESDLKRVLAYSTVVSLGTLITLIGLPAKVAASAMVTFLVVHALYKACLFMVAGIIDHETGTRDATRLGGLGKVMPLTGVVALMGGLSMAGLPPFVGFVGKELIYEAGLTAASPGVAVGIALLANACMVVVAGVVTVRCFFGPLAPTPDAPDGKPQDPSLAMLAGPAVLASLGLFLGIAPALAHGLLGPAASSVAGRPIEPTLSLWHGFTPMLALSVGTLVLGVLLLRHWHPLRRFLASLAAIDRFGPDATYDRIVAGLQRLATWQARLIQHGSLRGYLHATFAVVAVAVLCTMLARGGFAWPRIEWQPRVAQGVILPVLLILAALAVTRAASFISGIVSAGMVGFGLALTFLFNGAPDLAFTQFSVEALSIVLLLAIIGRMPFHEVDSRSGRERRSDALLATVLGIAAASILLAVVAGPFDTRLSDYFRQFSVPQAHGRNLVNVIIVDFRALDTLGEITVLALAALAAAAVLAGVASRSHDAARHLPEERP